MHFYKESILKDSFKGMFKNHHENCRLEKNIYLAFFPLDFKMKQHIDFIMKLYNSDICQGLI